MIISILTVVGGLYIQAVPIDKNLKQNSEGRMGEKEKVGKKKVYILRYVYTYKYSSLCHDSDLKHCNL